MDLWDMWHHVGLMWDAESERAVREGKDAKEEEEDNGRAKAYHSIFL